MIKKIFLLSACLSLLACNDHDHDTALQDATPAEKILVIGHRGASALRPEHTLASYQKAIDDGADFIEPDLVSTKDGVLIARHENEIGGTTNIATLAEFSSRKTSKTIDGTKMEGWFTEDFSLDELKQVKARERIPETRPSNTQYNDLYSIPTLEQIIELAEAHYKKTGKVIGLYIETKHPTYFQKQQLAMEDNLIKTLSKYQYTREIAPIFLQSFEVSNLKYLKNQLDLHKSLKNVKLIQLYDSPEQRPADYVEQNIATTYGDMATSKGLKEVSTYAQGVGPWKVYLFNQQLTEPTTFIADAHRFSLKVHPYTFRPENAFLPNQFDCSKDQTEKCESGSVAEISLYLEAGVDGFFTDDPAIGRKAVDQFLQKKSP